MPGDSGVLVVTRVLSTTTSAHEPRVQRASGIPHALWARKINAQLGRIAPRDREVMFGIGADTVIPGRCEASNPESRDSGSGSCGPSRNDGVWLAMTALQLKRLGCL